MCDLAYNQLQGACMCRWSTEASARGLGRKDTHIVIENCP